MGSTRFPGKPLKQILNKPMIQWVYEHAKKAKLVDELMVATDSAEILQAVESFGAKAILTSKNHSTGLDRIMEVAEKYPEFKYYINIQGDEPALHPDVIDGIAETLQNNPRCQIATAAIAFSCYENFINPHQVKVVFDNDNKALYFSRSPIPYRSDPENLTRAFKHLGIYGYEKTTLAKIKNLKAGVLESLEKLEQLRMLENQMSIYVYISKHDSIGVDTPEDVARAEQALAKKTF